MDVLVWLRVDVVVLVEVWVDVLVTVVVAEIVELRERLCVEVELDDAVLVCDAVPELEGVRAWDAVPLDDGEGTTRDIARILLFLVSA